MAEQASTHAKLEDVRTALMQVDSAVRPPFSDAPHKLPIYQTTTWRLKNPEEMEEALGGKLPLDVYTIFSGPNYRALEAKLAILEEGETAQVCAAGRSAIYATLATLAKPGQRIIAHHELYGGTLSILSMLRAGGCLVTYIDARDPTALEDVLSPETAVVYLESPSNPSLHIIDIAHCALVAHRYNPSIICVADNTFATPFNQRPLTLGADLVIESLTKYLDGRGTHFGGAVVGRKGIVEMLYPRLILAPMDPGVAWGISENILDFLQAMPLHNENAYEIAVFLRIGHGVERVHYPGFGEHINCDIAARQMVALDDGIPFGGVVSFELAGSRREAMRFVQALCGRKNALITHAVSVGNRDSLIEIPSCGTHRTQKGEDEKLIRFSVGIESSARLIEELNAALRTVFSVQV